MPAETQHLGNFGERTAAAHLEAKGYRIIGRKFRAADCEIDLVALDHGAVVFVEVRMRRGAYPGMAALSITRTKARKLLVAVDRYIDQPVDVDDLLVRIDVVAIVLAGDSKMQDNFHLEDADLH